MAGKRDQQMKEITERLEQGVKELFTSETYKEYLKTMSQFHNYSFNNTLLIALQKPDATLVAGYQAWQKKFKRQVKKGEKGIQIIAPAPIREKEEVEKFDPVTNEPILRPDGQPETEEVVHVIPRFRVTTVFDLSQTFGEPLPELGTEELVGNVENFESFMQAVREVSPVPIRFDNIQSGAKGFYSSKSKEIVIQEGMSEIQTMKTAIHEVTHAKLHDRELMEATGERKDKMTREVESESVAYTVCQFFGLPDTSDYSFPYITGWSSSMDMKELRSSMDTIRKTAGELIDGISEVMQRLMREQPEMAHLEENALILKVEFPESGFTTYHVVKNMEKEELLVELQSYHELYADSDEMTVETFLEGQGARLLPWYDSAGLQVEYPVDFYDVSYEYGSGITDADELPDAERAELLQKRAGYGKAEQGIGENADREANEELYLSGQEDRYAIYQIADDSKGREYRFMGLEYVTSHGMAVDAADYDFIYGGPLSGNETLDSLYEKFNLDHPAGYKGHSLSVSDVVVMQKDGQAKAYYVDRFGFSELPEFVRQRLNVLQMGQERDMPVVTADTSGIEIEQHEGLWHTVDMRKIAGENFYLMEHNDYGKSVAAVIVDAHGTLVAQELENGFERGAIEAIREYLAGKGISWQPEAEAGTPEENVYPPVYRHTLAYAVEHGAADEYLDSRKLNVDCKKAVEDAIRSHFDGMHLAHDAADNVLEKYGTERLSFVLACTVQYKETDGRFSRDTKTWAKSISVPENIGRGRDLNYEYVVESHPAVLDGYIGLARERFAELERTAQQEKKVSFISQYYVVNDAYGKNAEREYQYFQDLDSALNAYASFPNHLEKEIGMESTEQLPSRMALIKCRNGLEVLEDIEAASLSGKWINQETEAALRQAEIYLDNHETEVAYQMAGRYFTIQTTEGGYDYTLYDKNLRETDGGVLDDPNISMEEAIEEILAEEGVGPFGYEVIDYEEFLGRVSEAEQERNRKPLTAESVTELRGKSHSYDAGSREAVCEFDCLVDGKPAVLTYTKGQSEHFYSPLYDRGEIEDVFSIHTDGEDIWAKMPEPELSKLERTLAAEAEAFLIEERIAEAGSIYDLKDVDYSIMERETTAMGDVQRKRLWDAISKKGTAIIEGVLADVKNSDDLQNVYQMLGEVQGILGEEQFEKLTAAVQEKESELPSPEALPLISDRTEAEKSLNEHSCVDIEETVLCYVQSQIDEIGLTDEVRLLGARVYGSRTRVGLYQDSSDVDVVVSYRGNIREDDFFRMLHGDGLEVAGLPLDINPISEEKTGTLGEYMKRAEEYLDRKEWMELAAGISAFAEQYAQFKSFEPHGDLEKERDRIYQELAGGRAGIYMDTFDKIAGCEGDVDLETLEQARKIQAGLHRLLGLPADDYDMERTGDTISFYVAECMEFPVMGEYYDNLTLEEAVKKYEEIPADRINGVKGIGFRLEDGSIYDGDYELMSGGEILREAIDLVPHYKESPLVQKAIADLEKILSGKQDREVVPEVQKQESKRTEKSSLAKNKTGREASGGAAFEMDKPSVEALETRSTTSEGISRKESVLKALRERQAKRKAQESKSTEQKSQERKKGEQEL